MTRFWLFFVGLFRLLFGIRRPYVWPTAQDDAVRHEHVEQDGAIDWDDDTVVSAYSYSPDNEPTLVQAQPWDESGVSAAEKLDSDAPENGAETAGVKGRLVVADRGRMGS